MRLRPGRRGRWGAAGLAAVAAAVGLVGASQVPVAAGPATVTRATAGVVYDNIPIPLPRDVPSQNFEATHTSELGGEVSLAPGARYDAQVVVLLSSWACQSGHWYSGDCRTSFGSTFSEPVTLSVYQPGSSTAEGSAPGSLVGRVTRTLDVYYRPSADPSHCSGGAAGQWYDPSTGGCYAGLAQPVLFDLSGTGIVLPDQAVITVAYDTSDYGSQPYGRSTPCYGSPGGCAYDYLNVAVTGPPSAGSDPLADSAYIASSWSGAYCSSSTTPFAGLGLDKGCWGPYQLAVWVRVPTPTTLTANPSILRTSYGGATYFRLSAVLRTSAGNPIEGEVVGFRSGGADVCAGVTGPDGQVRCSGDTGVLQSLTSNGYHAYYFGGGQLLPSSAKGSVIGP